MLKSLVALTVALVATATMLASTAEAGFGIRLGFGGPLPSFTAHGGGGGYERRQYYRKRCVARRAAKKAVAQSKPAPKIAKVEKKVAKPKVVATAPASEDVAAVPADSENSSITATDTVAAAGTTAPGAVPVEVKADAAEKPAVGPKISSKLDCKKFFPSVGMTLTVPCE